MTWALRHKESEALASRAEAAARSGDAEAAVEFYHRAAEAEMLALAELDPSKVRTIGITAVSATALAYKARDYLLAETLAHEWLSKANLPAFARLQLRDLLQRVWTQQEQTTTEVKFTPGEVLVSVKGGEVVYGGAPLDLIVQKVEQVSAIFHRVAELLLQRPYRKRGSPDLEVRQLVRPWLFQAPAGSYQFTVRVQEPAQISLFPEARPRIEQITEKFMEILRASAADPDVLLPDVVPDPEYRTTFLTLARNLAPSGETFGQLELRGAVGSGLQPVILVPGTRDTMNSALKQHTTQSEKPLGKESQIRGTLRAVHLDRDWLEVTTTVPDGVLRHVRVYGAGEAVDDVIGPMVNRPVVVDTSVGRFGRHYFRDIQPAE